MAGRRQQIACLFILKLFHCCHSVQPPSNTDPAFIKEIVDAHNKFRAGVSPPAGDMLYMTWDKDLAKTAQVWANKCKFEHNPDLKKSGKVHPTFTPVGENIWIGSSNAPMSPTDSWAAEVQYYDYASRSCSKVCGHYTQVVWATSYKVGCAAAFCQTLTGTTLKDANIIVCDYAPAGNMQGQSPYKEEQACSGCSAKDTCENKLCKNSERDAVKESSWTPQSTGVTAFSQMQIYSPVLSLTYICLYFVA